MLFLKNSVRVFLLSISALYISMAYLNCSGMNGTSTTSDGVTTRNSTNNPSSGNLFLAYSPYSVTTGTQVTLAGYNGQSPYTFSLVSGSGSVSGNIFTPQSAGNVVIQVRDSSGATATETIAVQAQATAIPVYRFIKSGVHFFTTNYSDGSNNGFTYEGIAFYAYSAAIGSTYPIYRCSMSNYGRYFVTVYSDCSSYSLEATLGHIYASQVSGTVPLYSYFHPTNNDYIVTTSTTEGPDNGYTFQGVMGYVPTN